MAPRCSSSWNSAPTVCYILTTVLISTTFAKPFHSDEFTLSRADVNYYTTSPDYEYVKPVRLGTRHQRSAEDLSSIKSTTEITVEGFDQEFNIQLDASMDLFNAGLLVRHIDDQGRVRIEQPSTGCFHQGHLRDRQESTSVSMSTCDGLMGMIRTPEAEFGLKPLTKNHILQMTSTQDEVPTHIMYKITPSEMAVSQRNSENTRNRHSETERRETRDIKYLETSVVADSTMFGYHGDDTEFYLFTILNQVAGLFRDKSLSTELRMLVNSVTILEAPQVNLDLTDELSHSLKNFCEWQKDGKSDISILLTRRDLQIGGNHAVTGKAKEVGGACNPSTRCVISEDHGPSATIFTLAHEIGHSIGMYHDDAESGCVNDKNVMATDNSGGSEAFKWSTCSNRDLQEFLSSPDSECLNQLEEEFPAYNKDTIMMPGHFYDALRQCQMTFGPDATVADSYLYSQDMCTELQCTVKGELTTNHIPALDGTKCGEGRGMICVHGQCLKVVSSYECDGGPCVPEWLPGSFGECQADCYRYRNVFCVMRQDDGTTVLVTDNSTCPVEVPDEREYCCEPMPIGDNSTSYQIISSECSVTCGTGTATRQIACVNGDGNTVPDAECSGPRPATEVECAPAPCPGISYILFYSEYSECSVTCDNGVRTRTPFCSSSTGTSESVEICRQVFTEIVIEQPCNLGTCPGTVVETYSYTTTPISQCSVTCGEGEQQLRITCVDESGNVVSDTNCANLQRPSSNQACFQPDCTETYRYVATSFGACSATCGSGTRSRSVFCLNEGNRVVDDSFCAGLTRLPEMEDCDLGPCTITYSYVAQPFPECTLTCGIQNFTRTVFCRSSTGDIVSNTNCVNAGLEAPATFFDCGLEPCGNFVYRVGAYGPCSATCGIGIQQRSVECIDLDNNNETVSNDMCSEQTPVSAILCNLGDCPTEYTYLTSPFDACTCDGTQTRFVVCITFVNGAPVRASDVDCTNAGLMPPNTTQACEAPSTCNPVWRFGEWSDCSVSCGNGVQTRIVYCIESEESNVIVPSSSCNADEEPASVQICNSGDCVTYTWVSEQFGECSVTCGAGVRMRNVLCYGISGGNFQLVDGSLCNPALEPPSEEICVLPDCGGVYEATAWSECSVTCAVGMQTRVVSCVTMKGSGVEIAEAECANMTRPSESRECYLEPCPLPYGCDQSYPTEGSITYTLQSPNYPGDYPPDLECSKILVAPEGSIIRITFTDLQLEEGCAYDSIRLIDQETINMMSICDAVELPFVYESTSPMLEVLFVTDATINRPGFSATYQAVVSTVLEYATSEWGECSVTCGEGVEQRDLICLQDGEEVDGEVCIGLPIPSTTRPCQLAPCPPPDACGENILRTTPGVITSPGYPSQYTENITCGNTIRAPLGQVVIITLQTVALETVNTTCGNNDYLLIYDTSIGPIDPICSDDSGSVIVSLTNEVFVSFVSDLIDQDSLNNFALSYSFGPPEVDICGEELTVSGQPIYSPGYPNTYDDNVTCITNITNDSGCISIEFLSMDIDNGDRVDELCGDDVLTLTDYNNPSLSQSFCRSSAPEVRWLSASGSVKVSFTSNQANTSEGYVAIPRFVECPQAFWVPLPYGNCSASCGFGNRTRVIECRNALTNELTDPSNCPEEMPPTTAVCFLEECPGCDASLTEGDRVITFPLMKDLYLYNDECTLSITNENGCINLFFISLDIDDSVGDMCRDYLLIFDPDNMHAHEPYCGDAVGTQSYQSLGNTIQITLRAEDAQHFKSFEVYPSFGACPTHAFKPGPWSECSASCDGGNRTREVTCFNLQTDMPTEDIALCEDSEMYGTQEECNTMECPECSRTIREPGVLVSPGFDTVEGYDNNLDCMYNITNPNMDECVTISFESVDFGGPEENCSDYLVVTDRQGRIRERYCGAPENETLPAFFSRSSSVEVSFVTNEEGRHNGFEALIGFGPCPEFGFVAGNFSECSVTCGEGVETREVECRRFSNGQVVSDEICQDQRPEDSRPCIQPTCPSCDRVMTVEGIFTSPNSPLNYENNQDCEYTLIAPENECLRISFIATFELGLSAMDCEEGDFIEISDDNWEYLDVTYCGNRLPPVWRSRTNVSTVTFRSDEADTYRGFTAFLAFVSCPQYGFTVGEYGECNVTCGQGGQMRDVECTDLMSGVTVSQSLCTDPMPPSMRECNSGPCPSCGETYTTDRVSLRRDDFEVDEMCLYNVTSLDGLCVQAYLLDWDLSPSYNQYGQCEGDSLTFVDAAYPYRSATVCGQSEGLQQFLTYGSTGLIYFRTDNVENGGDFQVFSQFVECPEYGYTASEFSECSATCGVGYRTREVFCTHLASGMNVSFGNCSGLEEEPLSTFEPCIADPCFSCDMQFNDSATILSPGYPGNYSENLQCVYDLYNPNGCWALTFNDFELQEPVNGTCLDGLLVADSFEGRDPYWTCGSEFEEDGLLSFSNTVQITFYSNGQGVAGGFNLSLEAVPCPEYVYVIEPYGECSVTCGEGVRTRDVFCQNLTSGETVDDSLCIDFETPQESEECILDDCPVCFEGVAENAQYITSPNYPENYENGLGCTTVIFAPEGMCINLFFIAFELQEPGEYAGCFETDYLAIIDASQVTSPFFTFDQVLCGTQDNILWTSISNIVYLSFVTSEEDSFGGYEIYSSFVDCQRYVYLASAFSNCSASCGLGTATREVFCLDRNNNFTVVNDSFCDGDLRPVEAIPCYIEDCPPVCDLYINETQYIATPNYPEDDYDNDLNCMVELENPDEGGCWEITFLDFDVDCSDSLTIKNSDFDLPAVELCGLEVPPPYRSISNHIELIFNTDDEDGGLGFNASIATVDCLFDYAFIPGPWGECSVSCGDDGEGVQMRNVSCFDLESKTSVNASFCNASLALPTQRPCMDVPPCPPCRINVTSNGIQSSPNYPDPYDLDETCITVITPPLGFCTLIFIISMQLPEPDENLGCLGVDNLQIYNVMPPYALTPTLDQVFCGLQQSIRWVSATNDPIYFQFTSDETDAFPGYQLNVQFVQCNDFYYTVSNFSECSVSCGYGVQTRQVQCVNASDYSVVDDSLCTELSPLDSIPCFNGECPSCDRYITENDVIATIPNGYPEEQECEYTYVNEDGGCIGLRVILNLPAANSEGECEADYIEYSEEGEYGREMVFCGESEFNMTSRYNTTIVTFVSDDNEDPSGTGFVIANRFVDCPVYGYIAEEEYGECDVTCGGGVQMRDVSCIHLSNGTVVDDALCTDPRPESTRVCGDERCPICYQYINTTNSFINVANYEANADCLFSIDLGDRCARISFLAFDLQSQVDGECVDFLEIDDLAPFTELTDQTFCGAGPAFGYAWFSRSPRVDIRFQSDDSIEDQGFNLFVQETSCPTQGFTYGNYSECSVTCGQGEQVRQVLCSSLDNGVPGAAVLDSLCRDPRPISMQECELDACPSCDRNFTVFEPESSVIVGSRMPYFPDDSCTNTIVTDEGMCIRLAFANMDIEETDDCVNDSLVITDPDNESINFTLCNRGGIILPIFSIGNRLTLTLTSNGAIEGDGYNSIASRIDCPDVDWATEITSPCSVTCGTGVQTRNVFCMNQVNRRTFFQEESCTGPRPNDTVACVLDDCPEACNRVVSDESVTELTSPGYPDTPYENNLTCPNTFVPTTSCLAVRVVDIDMGPPENCANDFLQIFDSAQFAMDYALRLCGNQVPVNNLWVGALAPFYTLLTTDGMDVYPGYNLSFSYVPCPEQGFTVGEFGECSMVCGSGVMRRNVTCENSTGDILPDTACWGQRPLAEQPCGMNCTYNADIGTWSACSATCGNGAVQTRTVDCVSGNSTVVNASFCDNAGVVLPDTMRTCNLTDCPEYEYITSNYSECSVTCGEGIQNRTVTCVRWGNTTLGDIDCGMEGVSRPNDTRSCSLPACPTYQYVVSNYSECSVTCGEGIQERNVTCQDNLGNVVNSTYCAMANLTAPESTMNCSLPACDLENCNYNISGIAELTGNITSPLYPAATPPNVVCTLNFFVENNYLLNIQFQEFNLASGCSENITLTGDVAGPSFFCMDTITLPASATFTSDSVVSLVYQTDGDESNTPYYFATWQLVNLAPPS